jgi:hypothetical protein
MGNREAAATQFFFFVGYRQIIIDSINIIEFTTLLVVNITYYNIDSVIMYGLLENW